MFLTKANSGINCTNPMISQSAGDTGDTGEWGEERPGVEPGAGSGICIITVPWHPGTAALPARWPWQLRVFRVWCVWGHQLTPGPSNDTWRPGINCAQIHRRFHHHLPSSSQTLDTGYWIRQSPEHKNVLLARYLCSAQIIPAAKLVEYHVSWIPNIWNITELYFSRKWSRLNVSV